MGFAFLPSVIGSEISHHPLNQLYAKLKQIAISSIGFPAILALIFLLIGCCDYADDGAS